MKRWPQLRYGVISLLVINNRQTKRALNSHEVRIFKLEPFLEQLHLKVGPLMCFHGQKTAKKRVF